MKKALIIGASGLLGGVFAQQMEGTYRVWGTYKDNIAYGNPPLTWGYSHLDIINYREVADLFSHVQPDIVIHCAGIANVDKCEDNTKLAWDTHEVGTENVSQWCRKANSKLVYISTDSVFDGTIGNYHELSETHPINVYGASKLRGEKVTAWAKDYLVIRTAFFDRLAKWVIENLKENKEISMFRDVYASPIFAVDLVDIIIKMCEQDLKGVYHVGGKGSWSKYEFGVYLAKELNLNPFLIKRIMVKTLKERVPRPKNLSLDCGKVERDLGIKVPTLQEGLKRFKEGYEQNKTR